MYILTSALLGISAYGLFKQLPQHIQDKFLDMAVEQMAKARIAARRLCPRGQGVETTTVSRWTEDNEQWVYATYYMYNDDAQSPKYGIIYCEAREEEDFKNRVHENLEAFLQVDLATGAPKPFGVCVVNSQLNSEMPAVQIQPLMTALAGPSCDFRDNQDISLYQVVKAAQGEMADKLDDIGDENRQWTFFDNSTMWSTADEAETTLGQIKKGPKLLVKGC